MRCTTVRQTLAGLHSPSRGERVAPVRLAVTMIVAGLMAVPASALAQDSSSSFSQLTGANGCVSQEPPLPGDDEALEGCGRARGLLNALAVAVSPDDKHVYVASSGADTGTGSNAVVAFSRAGDTGALTSVGCVSDSGGDGRTGHRRLLRERRRAARRERRGGEPRRPARVRLLALLQRHRVARARRSDRQADARRLHQELPARGPLPGGLRARGDLGCRGEPGRQERVRHR